MRLSPPALVVLYSLLLVLACPLAAQPPASRQREYLWYEAENMGGLSLDARNEPRLNPVWQNLPRAKAPGWGINGPGVSAEWSQGGESEWNSVAASPDETRATLFQDVEIPRDGVYHVWARYADFANKDERFAVRLIQQGREVTGNGASTNGGAASMNGQVAGTRGFVT